MTEISAMLSYIQAQSREAWDRGDVITSMTYDRMYASYCTMSQNEYDQIIEPTEFEGVR